MEGVLESNVLEHRFAANAVTVLVLSPLRRASREMTDTSAKLVTLFVYGLIARETIIIKNNDIAMSIAYMNPTAESFLVRVAMLMFVNVGLCKRK